jgi:hypothetical protein
LRPEVRLRAFGELGTERYRPVGFADDLGEDDLTAYGLTAQIQLPRRVVANLTYRVVDRQSEVVEFDRRQESIIVSLNYRGNVLPW